MSSQPHRPLATNITTTERETDSLRAFITVRFSGSGPLNIANEDYRP